MEQSFTKVPTLVKDDKAASTDEEKAEMLMETFFPPQATPREPGVNQAIQPEPVAMAPLTEDEVKRAIFTANPRKAPGADGLTFRVWRELWPVVGRHVSCLYQALLRLGHLLRA